MDKKFQDIMFKDMLMQQQKFKKYKFFDKSWTIKLKILDKKLHKF